jgi:hypothetical protein
MRKAFPGRTLSFAPHSEDVEDLHRGDSLGHEKALIECGMPRAADVRRLQPARSTFRACEPAPTSVGDYGFKEGSA